MDVQPKNLKKRVEFTFLGCFEKIQQKRMFTSNPAREIKRSGFLAVSNPKNTPSNTNTITKRTLEKKSFVLRMGHSILICLLLRDLSESSLQG